MLTIEDILRSVSTPTDSKIVLLVMDGLGGLPVDGQTELEAANTPNLDALAGRAVCGLTDPVCPGITPGSGPGHLGIFGYDPMKYEIGRGVLEALGVGIEPTERDVAARANFATLKEGKITDRRAGRPATERNRELCAALKENIKEIDGVEIIIESGEEHRFVILFRGDGLNDQIEDADPGHNDFPPKPAVAKTTEAEGTAKVINKFISRATDVLKDCPPTNTVLVRGFAKHPHLPSMKELFKLSPAAVAPYPMYKGLARLVGMKVLETGKSLNDQVQTLKENFGAHDFFYFHVKKVDSYGEDGNFSAKKTVIEETDKVIPELLKLNPHVIAVTSDHSTPALMKSHSWHPNPFLLYSKYVRTDDVQNLTERECAKGGLGRFPAKYAMSLMLANAGKLEKFGA